MCLKCIKQISYFDVVHIIVDFRQDSSYYFNDKFVNLIKKNTKEKA